MGNTKVTKNPDTHEMVFERVFDAPRDVVWKAWSDQEQLTKWWGPHGWETTIKEFNFEPGGVWHYCMKCVDKNQGEFYGQEAWGKATYKDIDEPNKITYVDEFSDADGGVQEGTVATDVSLEFIDMDGKTKLVNRNVFASKEAYEQVLAMGMEEGLKETWDRLDEYVSGK